MPPLYRPFSTDFLNHNFNSVPIDTTARLQSLLAVGNFLIVLPFTAASKVYRIVLNTGEIVAANLPSSIGNNGSIVKGANNRIFVVGSAATGYYSDDFGATWSVFSTLPPINSQCLAANENGIIFCGTNGAGIFSNDNGATWQNISTPHTPSFGTAGEPQCAIWSNIYSLFIVVGSGSSFWTSPDGNNWTQITPSSYPIVSNANVVCEHNGYLYIGGTQGETIRTNGLLNGDWELITTFYNRYSTTVVGNSAYSVRSMVSKGNEFYIGHNNCAIEYTADNGQTWIPVTTSIPQTSNNQIIKMETANGEVFAVSNIYIFKSLAI